MSESPIPDRAGPDRPGEDRPLRWRRSLACAALAPLGWLALRWLASRPDRVETYYSSGVFAGVRGVQGFLAGLFPFSVVEVLLFLGVAWCLYLPGKALFDWKRRRRSLRNLFLRGALRGLSIAGVLYFAFLVLWGFNHAREPYATHAGLEPGPVSPAELRGLGDWLVLECNRLRAELAEGELELKPGPGGVDPRLVRGYEVLGREVEALRGGKPLLRVPWISPVLSRLGISGIYSPFTGEAHRNGEIVPWLRPFVSCHEIAHLKGFAREDEANFIAWQVCRRTGEPVFAYSASNAALASVLSALSRFDREAAQELWDRLDGAARADQEANSAFWEARRSRLTELATRTNDAYLRSQGQEQGVKSYGRMVDLLVAERRKHPGGGDVER